MSGYRKLSRRTGLRRAILRELASGLIVNGKVKTTYTRALEVQRMAERFITLALKEQNNFEMVEVPVSAAKLDAKGRKVLKSSESKSGAKYDVVERELKSKQVQKDKPSRLAARRYLLAELFEHSDAEGNRLNTVNHLFNVVAPRYVGKSGGYTRITKLGQRRGDAAELVLLELI